MKQKPLRCHLLTIRKKILCSFVAFKNILIMKTVKITIIGTIMMYDYCSQKNLENLVEQGLYDDISMAFGCEFLQTACWVNFDNGGMYINDDEENDVIKQKGKYVKTKEYFHELWKEDGQHPLPVEIHSREWYECDVDYIVEIEDDEEFDIKKVQLVKSDYECEGIPYFIIADYILYDGKKVDAELDLFDLCPDEKTHDEWTVDLF